MLASHSFSRLLIAVVACTSTNVLAAQCRATKAVKKSAVSVAFNTASGGHVALHIMGNRTEAGKSQFVSEPNFNTSWTNWMAYSGPVTQAMPAPKVCGGGSATIMDCVSADKVGVREAYVCDTVNAEGNCTNGHLIIPAKVAFRYAKNSKGVWILNTAYPSANQSCS